MKIGKQTFEILKNFTAINNSIWVNEPTCLKTLSIAENIIGIYDTEETWPEFQLYNSVPFMSICSLYDLDKIDFDFGDNAVVIKTAGVRTTIVYDDPDLIPKLGDLKEASVYKQFSDFDATFDLSSDQINQIQKAANILGLPDMTVKLTGGKGLITISDDEAPDTNNMKVAVKDGEGDCEVSMMVKNLQIVSGDYTVSVSSGKMAKFHHKKYPLFYIVAAKQG
jgi:hypothetical protein